MLHDIRSFFTGEDEIQSGIRALEAMSDHDLADLGISRDQIEDYVTGQFARKG